MARGSDGSHFPVSIEFTVCRDTPSTSPSSACERRRSVRSCFTSLRTGQGSLTSDRMSRVLVIPSIRAGRGGRSLVPVSAPATYASEEFTDEEADVLRRYVTNLDGPVFALVNLPEVVKGALFARYSRTHKSLRRLFLDEFVGELDTAGDASVDATVGLEKAEALYQRVFFEYGDDSVAQLGGVHLACEQASNLLTKVLEWGRLMAYLEQSTRYLAYDTRLGGRYRYHRPPDVLSSPFGTRYVADLDGLFATYADLLPQMQD